MVQATNGNLYGTTSGVARDPGAGAQEDSGGVKKFGTVFKITPSGKLTTLHSFKGTDGKEPYSNIIQGTDSNLYGTTLARGDHNCRTIFKATVVAKLTTLPALTGRTAPVTGCQATMGISTGQRLWVGPTPTGRSSDSLFVGGCGTVCDAVIGGAGAFPGRSTDSTVPRNSSRSAWAERGSNVLLVWVSCLGAEFTAAADVRRSHDVLVLLGIDRCRSPRRVQDSGIGIDTDSARYRGKARECRNGPATAHFFDPASSKLATLLGMKPARRNGGTARR